MPNDDEDLDVYWDAIRPIQRSHVADIPLDRDPLSNALVIGTRSRPLVTIKSTGELIYGPGYTPDEAAVIFWEEMGRRRLEAEERILIIQHMEGIMVRLGQADIRCERLRRQAAAEEDPQRKAELEQLAELSMNSLNMVAHQAIELGRGLAMRDMQPPEIPEQVPPTLQRPPEVAYEGREGLPEDET